MYNDIRILQMCNYGLYSNKMKHSCDCDRGHIPLHMYTYLYTHTHITTLIEFNMNML